MCMIEILKDLKSKLGINKFKMQIFSVHTLERRWGKFSKQAMKQKLTMQ